MRKLVLALAGCLVLGLLPGPARGREALVADHRCTRLEALPVAWLEAARDTLQIGYGHTSHGSQITAGMGALAAHFPDGRFAWSQSRQAGALYLFEGDGYGSGWLDHDCGYSGWDRETREYLAAHPECNVIMWSWCGQVNDVDLASHYFQPMGRLEAEYPGVTFVYMTGHLEGSGADGSLQRANQAIRDYCLANGKVLFDFADIESYDPDQKVSYLPLNADDACSYVPASGGTANWADQWTAANPDHPLTAMAGRCESCAHSRPLNCVQKGIAAWWLWARLAGWDGSPEGEPGSQVPASCWGEVKAQATPSHDAQVAPSHAD